METPYKVGDVIKFRSPNLRKDIAPPGDPRVNEGTLKITSVEIVETGELFVAQNSFPVYHGKILTGKLQEDDKDEDGTYNVIDVDVVGLSD